MVRFGIKTPDGQVIRLDDLPVEVLQGIAEDAGLESWFDVYVQPARYGKAAEALYRHACGLVGCEPLPFTVAVLNDALEVVEDDLPTMWEDGEVDPPEADAPTTD